MFTYQAKYERYGEVVVREFQAENISQAWIYAETGEYTKSRKKLLNLQQMEKEVS